MHKLTYPADRRRRRTAVGPLRLILHAELAIRTGEPDEKL
jgi:hypothetical protein